jgi:hypothetical protein
MRIRLTYANVVSTMALIGVVGGGPVPAGGMMPAGVWL